jgi:TfoX/Sxy family transcriptional regulator of competence genes
MAAMPKPSEETKQFFRSVLPDDDRVTVRPMFGQVAAFVNDHMFSGVYGDDLFVRPGVEEWATLLDEPGAAVFAPMAGRPMKEHVVLPRAWRGEPARARVGAARAGRRRGASTEGEGSQGTDEGEEGVGSERPA